MKRSIHDPQGKLCGCCRGPAISTPLAHTNRPGLDALTYRVGTHGSFMETMKRRLTSLYLKLPPDEVDSWMLTVGDLYNPARLATRLQDARDAFSEHLYAQFSQETRDALEAHGQAGALPPQLRDALIDELNQALRGSILYTEERLAHLVLTQDIKHLLAQEDLTGDDVPHLNRLLLELAYPREIRPRQHLYPLHGLTTRESDDASIAMLDAWATVADVLTFYQERFANEGYLRTATQRRSILELARLVGYRLRPGVAASVYLAFTMEKGYAGEIPAGTRAQSLPGPGELPQSFETSQDLIARAEWNEMKPRLQIPQLMRVTTASAYIRGLHHNLKPNDPMLVIGIKNQEETGEYFRRVHEIETQRAEDRTRVFLRGDLTLNALDELLIEPSIKVKLPTPVNIAPLNNNENLLTDITLRWRPGDDPDLDRGEVTYRVAWGEIDELPNVEETKETNHQVSLENNKTYRWSVTAVDGCTKAEGATWQFTTAEKGDEDDLSIPSAPHPEDGAILETSGKPVTLEWQGDPPLESSEDTLTYQVAFGTENPLEKTEEDSSVGVDDSSQQDLTSPDDERDWQDADGLTFEVEVNPGFTYYWQVKAIKETGVGESEVIGPVWSFVIKGESSDNHDDNGLDPADEDRKTIGETVIKEILGRFKIVSQDLTGLTLSAVELRTRVGIEGAGLDEAIEIVETIDQIEDSLLDFCECRDWLQKIKTEITDIFDQSDLLRGVISTPGRLYPDRFIDPNIVHKIIQALDESQRDEELTREAVSDKVFARGAFPKIVANMEILLETLRDANRSEDEKIVAVEAERNRLGLVKEVFVVLDAFPLICAWIGDSPDPADGDYVGLLNLLNQVTQGRPSKTALPWLIQPLLEPPALQPENALKLDRTLEDVFREGADIAPRLLTTLQRPLKDTLYQAWARAKATSFMPQQSLEALRVKATPYGAKAPERKPEPGKITPSEPLPDGSIEYTVKYSEYELDDFIDLDPEEGHRILDVLTLDADYSQIMPGGWIIIEWPEDKAPTPRKDSNGDELGDVPPHRLIRRIVEVQTVSKPNYGRVTKLKLNENWLDMADDLSILRNAVVYAQSDTLPLAEKPLAADDYVKGKTIQLDGLYEGLEAGRWLVVSGERSDVPGTSEVRASELIMLAGVTHSILQGQIGDDRVDLPGDTPHTTLELANEGLAYSYKRDTVTIYGNVVKATHGETRQEVLGSGDGSQAMQSFALKQTPLTHLAAPTRGGSESTLQVRVNDVLWHEGDNLVFLGNTDRRYITRTDDEDKTSVIFGDGEHGARLPTGIENVRAVYRTGIGKPGNVSAEQISLLATRPLGVKGVINPLPATGGADRESRDQARRNVPLALMALDRLVSVQDYADFSRTFAGIGKASAVQLSDGRQDLIHLTIAGADDIPISVDSDLYRGLYQALCRYGTLRQPVQVDMRELMLLVISAKVRLLRDYQWESVAPQVRANLLEAFSFDRRQLGQDALLSEAISIVQHTPGVAYVDVDVFDSVLESTSPEELGKLAGELVLKDRILVNMARIQTQHVVERNSETLSAIAGRYKVGEIDLWQLNPNITDPNNLKEHDELLRIPRTIRPAQLAYLSPEVTDMLILREVIE